MNQQIMCTVNSCAYWGQGNICEAPKILVTSDAIGDAYPESMDANEVTQLVQQAGLTPATTCMETCCKTFTRKKQ
ncbi:MAG: DUF1540 domain-containing protein [Clostridia bacterium]|nr:DUF1540 domain-containing protein [Clostridia bacterium]